jgi:AcrR family transcriptional regulator
MDMIAEEATLGKATIYYYFRSKEELLSALLERGIDETLAMLEEKWRRCADPICKLEAIAYVAADFFSRNPDYFRLYNYLVMHPSLAPKILPRLMERVRQKVLRISALLMELRESGLMRDLPVEDVLFIFGSMVMGLGNVFRAEDLHRILHRRAEVLNDILLRGILKTESNSEGGE